MLVLGLDKLGVLSTAMDKKRSQFQTKLALQGYSMLLVGELQAACLPVSAAPEIPGQRPIIPLFEPRFMPVPRGLQGGWDSFTWVSRPSQDLGYAPDTLDNAGPSIDPLAGDDDSDDDTDRFVGDDNSQQDQPFVVT